MATINPSQDYDIIHTLTFNSASGTCNIRLHRGSPAAFSGTVYYRVGTSGSWTPLSVSGTSTTFPVTATTMQVAHDWNKSGNNYMTPSFRDNANLLGIAISQKAVLSGVMGNSFMYVYAFNCSSLTSLAVPDTSNVTSVGTEFMRAYARGCSSLTTLDVPDTSNVTSVGVDFMVYYARDCSSLTTLSVPDTSNLTSTGNLFMSGYAADCTSLTRLELPKVGWFEANNVDWSVPSTRLGILKGIVLDPADLSDWKFLASASGRTLWTNYIRDPDDVISHIDPSQDYDIIHTLTLDSASGTVGIRLHRGSFPAFSGTVYYRAGTSGSWTSLSVSGTTTTFPVTSTTMQVAHDWNKSGDNYMTPSFRDNPNLLGIDISQKAPLSGVVGDFFMYAYARDCTSLTSLAAPDTSNVTSVGDYLMEGYAFGCSSLTSLDVPDTSNLTSAGNNFMYQYARDCTSLTSLSVPDASNVTSVGSAFMYDYAYNCSSLTSLDVPDTSNLTSVGISSFMDSYAYGCSSLTTLAVPDTSSLTSAGVNFMRDYAADCTSLTQLTLPAAGWFENNNIDWSVPSSRLGILKGAVLDPADLADWKFLASASGRTLWTNYIRDPDDVILLAPSFNPHISRRRLLV